MVLSQTHNARHYASCVIGAIRVTPIEHQAGMIVTENIGHPEHSSQLVLQSLGLPA